MLRGQFPPSLDVLLEGGEKAYIQQERILICPKSGEKSYVYIPSQTTIRDPRNVLLYEPFQLPDAHSAISPVPTVMLAGL